MSDQNGTAPAETGQAQEEATTGERLLGALGVVFGIVVAAIGVDLLTGGAVSRLVGLGPVSDADTGSG